MHLVTVATCQLHQWSLDFSGNCERILRSIAIAKSKGASIRVGPELDVTGYGCLDHFLEGDTILHAWEVLGTILQSEETRGIVCDIGMPIAHKNTTYNCRVIIYDGKIVMIRPKMWMANDGNYVQFVTRVNGVLLTVDKERVAPFHPLAQASTSVPFGDAVVSTEDTVIGVELCEELFTPASPHILMGLDGVEIFTNSSASHHELRKLNRRVDLIKEATTKLGGIYLYANQQGCDGDRLYYDGACMIALNGQILAQGSQFSLSDVEVVTATIDLEAVRAHRTASSRRMQAAQSEAYERIYVDTRLDGGSSLRPGEEETKVGKVDFHYHTPEEEIALGPACWLWDYLRRSRMQGYFLPLSGGIDSCATAVIVHSMCRLVVETVQRGDEQVIADARRMTGEPEHSTYAPSDPKEFANRIFHTCYMGTENSSPETRKRAKDLAESIGSYHVDLNMDLAVSAVKGVFSLVTGRTPQFKVHGGSSAENLALQNIQARLRMVVGYMFAQLLPWARSKIGGLLVLGSANVDESLRGYLTKYERVCRCSSADVNPIGGISKTDLKRFIAYAETAFDLPILGGFLDAIPSAELIPIGEDNAVQSDEVEMGMTYDELSIFGRLRKVEKCGPYSMFGKLVQDWGSFLSPQEIAQKVKHFFFTYAINRHKMTTITPSVHLESYSPDDNRFDMRPFLYPARFDHQFHMIDTLAESLPNRARQPGTEKIKMD